MDNKILEKWKNLIDACKAYYIDCVPTGYTDKEYDELEERAITEDGFYARDYVLDKYLKGTKTENHYIEKFKKDKVEGSMLGAIQAATKELGNDTYWTLKYDGCSIAIYPDPQTGVPKRIVTVGNTNLSSFGVDQTWKLIDFVPKKFPEGIVAIQCEALIDLKRLGEGADPDRARQAVNGLINGKKEEVLADVENLLTLRAYRYYTDSTALGVAISRMDYREVLKLFQTVVSPVDGHVLFAPADVFTLEELENNPDTCKEDRTETTTGTFLNDGWVAYSNCGGNCYKALKFAGAGSGTELIKSTVQGIQWNNQASKGKDSWSANVRIDPVSVHGSIVRKPSAGSVSKLISKNITKGATVSIIMANSTIPMVGECFSPGNGDFSWPTCSCGYKMSEKDIYGSLLKCGNPMCSERIGRMRNYIHTLINIYSVDLNKLLVIDRFDWNKTGINIKELLEFVKNDDSSGYYGMLCSFLTTDLQMRNINLVWQASWVVLRESFLVLENLDVKE